jgi:hypothetical protein
LTDKATHTKVLRASIILKSLKGSWEKKRCCAKLLAHFKYMCPAMNPCTVVVLVHHVFHRGEEATALSSCSSTHVC